MGVRKAQSQRRWDVVGFGENSVDLVVQVDRLPPPDQKGDLLAVDTRPGGQIATAMVGCARLGLKAAYLGVFGQDEHAALIRRSLDADGVDVSHCRTVAAGTRTAVVLVERATANRTVLARRDHALDWPPDLLPLDVIADARALLVDATDLHASVAAATAARSAGVVTVADVDADVPGLARLLPVIDVLVVSQALADSRPDLMQQGPMVVIATLGADGAVAWDGTCEWRSPGFVVPAEDTTGAGDAFRAGLITRLLEHLSVAGDSGLQTTNWREILDFANAVAALNCLQAGAQTGLPRRPDVDALVTNPSSERSNRIWGREPPVPLRSAERESGTGA
jgi:sugar/nucleoside kinase (ribokinase family)